MCWLLSQISLEAYYICRGIRVHYMILPHQVLLCWLCNVYAKLDAHTVQIFRVTWVLAVLYNIVKYEHWALGKTSAATTHDELRRSVWIFIVCCLLRLALAMKRIYKRCRVAEVYSKATTLADHTKRIYICAYSYIVVLYWKQKSYELSQAAAYIYLYPST